MNPSSRIKSIAAFVLLIAMSISSVATSATTTDPLLNMIPADSLFCVRVNNLDQSLSNLDQYLTGVAPMQLSMMAKLGLGGIMGDPMLSSVNTQGSIAIFAVMSEGQPAMGIIMPTESFQKFTSSNQNASAPDVNGISTITGQFAIIPGMPPSEVKTYATALPKKGFMLLSPDSETLGTLKKAMAVKPIATTMDKADISVAKSDAVWARVNIAKLNELFGPMINFQLEGLKQQVANEMANAPAGQKPPFEVDKLMGIYFNVFQKLLSDSDFLSLSINPTPTALGINYTYGAKKDSDIAGLLVDSNTPDGPFKTAGYLDGKEAVNMLFKVDKNISAKTNAKMLEVMSAIMGEESEKHLVKWKTLMVDSVEAMGEEQAFSMSLAKGSPPFRMKQIIMVDDAEKYMAVTKESFAMVNDIYKSFSLPVTIAQNASSTEKYKGTKIESIDIDIDAEKLVGGDPEATQMLNKIYENMGLKSAITKDYCLITMGPNATADVKKLIDRTNSPAKAATGDLATAMKLIKNSDKAEFICSINPLRIAAGFGQMMQSFPIPEQEMAMFNKLSTIDAKSTSCIAMAGNVGEGKATVNIVIPKQHLMEIYTAITSMMPGPAIQQ